MRSPSFSFRPRGAGVALLGLLALGVVAGATPQLVRHPHVATHEEDEPTTPVADLPFLSNLACEEGRAGPFPCRNVRLAAFVPLREFQMGVAAPRASDLWGWTDEETGREYVLLGLTTGTAFVEVTNPEAPVFVGLLPTETIRSAWRDVKVYRDHAFVVSEAVRHGMQVFDLRTLRTVSAPPVELAPVAVYREGDLGSAHNVAVNEETGFAYVVGSETCRGGLHIVDVREPARPAFAGCYQDDLYTHDVQCVVYHGPDERYREREICFAANEDTLTLVDVTDKAAPVGLARVSYEGSGYVHQGWLTEDHLFFLLGDELDEVSFGHPTKTYLWDVTDLTAPVLVGAYTGPTPAIDHNLYVRDGLAYEANYTAGLRVLDLSGLARGELAELAFFDVVPEDDEAKFSGAWSVYPFFPSGTIAVSGIEQGLFLLELDLP